MIMDDNDGEMKFGNLGGLKLPNICLTCEEKPRKNLTQESCPDRGSNPGPLRDTCASARPTAVDIMVNSYCLLPKMFGNSLYKRRWLDEKTE